MTSAARPHQCFAFLNMEDEMSKLRCIDDPKDPDFVLAMSINYHGYK